MPCNHENKIEILCPHSEWTDCVTDNGQPTHEICKNKECGEIREKK